MNRARRWILCLVVLVMSATPWTAVAEELAAEQQLNAYYTLMTLSLTSGDYEKALEYAQQCLSMDSILDDALRADIYLKQGYALMYLYRFDEAIEALDESIAVSPDASDAMLLKMQTYAAQSDEQAAMDQADAYLEAYPDQTEVYTTLGEIFAAGGDYASAIEAYDQYFAVSEAANPAAYQMRGQYLLQLGRYDEAIADLTQAIEAGGEQADVRTYYLRAISRMQVTEYAAAMQDLDVCVAYLEEQEALAASDPDYEPQIDADVLYSRYYRGIAGMQMASYEQAIADFTACVDAQVNAQYAQFWRGVCLLDSGSYDRALEDFQACSENEVEVESCLYYTALCHMGMGEYQTAVECFTQCIDQGVMTSQSLYNRGMCYIQLGDTEKGQADLEQSVGDESPSEPVAEAELPDISE